MLNRLSTRGEEHRQGIGYLLESDLDWQEGILGLNPRPFTMKEGREQMTSDHKAFAKKNCIFDAKMQSSTLKRKP